MTRVALVTDELHPLTHGGIGRLLRNVLDEARGRDAPVEFHLLIPRSRGITPEILAREVGSRVRLHLLDLLQEGSEVPTTDWSDAFWAKPAAFGSIWHAQSYQIAQELRRLEKGGLVFDTIEFPDFRGWALCTLQEKRLGRAFKKSLVAVRLHSTLAVLRHFEEPEWPPSTLLENEQEREALLLADKVIAHLEPVADFNRAFFGFDDRWRRRVATEFPPVLPPPAATARAQKTRGPDAPLVFATRTNPCKRPDLFIQGAAEFMQRRPDYLGKAILACHVYHPDYLRRLLDDVPRRLCERFIVLGTANQERERLVAEGITIVPSIYESLNLVAYEVSAAGGLPVLNERCLAFGERTPFIDGLNCLKFDGTVDGLAACLERALDSPSLRPVEWQAATPYWEKPLRTIPPRRAPRPRVSVVIAHRDAAEALAATLESVAASTYEDVQAIVVDDGSCDAPSKLALERIAAESQRAPEAVHVVQHLEPRGRAAAWNDGARAALGDLLMFLDAGDRLASTFIEEAVHALMVEADLSGVLPAVEIQGQNLTGWSGQATAQILAVSEAPCPGLLANPGGLRPLLRRSAFPTAIFDDMLDGHGPWSALLALGLGGGHLLGSPAPGCSVQPPDVAPMSPSVRRALLARAALKVKTVCARTATLSNLLLAARWDPPPRKNETTVREKPLRYELVDGANEALKRIRGFHGLLRKPLQRAVPGQPIEPASLGLWSPGATKPLRYEMIDWAYAKFKQRAPNVGPFVRRAVNRFR
jgi:glycosyltransferase involved in cell wall biosynthesis